MPARGSKARVYTLDEKIGLVTKIDQLVRAGLSTTAAAEAAGLNWSSYTNWINAGIKPTKRPAPVQRTPEERARLVAAVQARIERGATAAMACLELGVPESQFFKWRRQLAPLPPLRPVEVAGEVTALVPVAPTAMVTAASTAISLPEPMPPAPGRAELCLVAPGGYRIEGLGVETAAALLRALA